MKPIYKQLKAIRELVVNSSAKDTEYGVQLVEALDERLEAMELTAVLSENDIATWDDLEDIA
jgi:hypothetical protein